MSFVTGVRSVEASAANLTAVTIPSPRSAVVSGEGVGFCPKYPAVR